MGQDLTEVVARLGARLLRERALIVLSRAALVGAVLLVTSEIFLRTSPAWAAIAFVQAGQNLSGSGGSSISVTLSNNAAGDLLAVACREGVDATSISSVTDTAGNTYTMVNHSSSTAGGFSREDALFYAANIKSAASNTISCNFASSLSTTVGIVAEEFSGVATSAPTDGNVTSSDSTGTALSLSSGSLTTTNANDLLIYEVTTSANETFTAGTGYTIPANGTNARQAVQYNIVSSSGTYSTSLSWNSGASGDGVFAAFKAACPTVSNASYVVANGQNAQTTVYWSSANVLVLEKAGSSVTDVPVNGTAYSAGQTIGTSTVVFAGSGSSVTPSGTHTNGTIYYYKVFVNNGSNCYSSGTAISASPLASSNWEYSTGATTLAAPGLDPNDVVVAGSNDQNIHFIHTANGTLDWAPLGYCCPINAQPVVVPAAYSQIAKNVAYVTRQGSGRVIAADTGTGTQIWSSPALGSSGTVTAGAAVWLQKFGSLQVCGVNTDAVFVGNNVTAGGFNSTLYALNGSNSTVVSNGSGNCVANGTNVAPGGILWSYVGDNTTKFLDIIASTPYVDYTNGAVWVTSESGGATNHPSVWMFDATNGQLKSGGTNTWNLNDIDADPTPNLYDGSYIYVGTKAGSLYAIQVSTRSVIGPYTPTTGSGAVAGVPWPLSFNPVNGTTKDTIIFTQSTYVQSVSFDGSTFSKNWTQSETWTGSAPVDDGANHLYIGGSDGKVHELDVATGTDHTSTNPSVPGAPTVGAPAFDVNLNRIYVGASDGHIYSFTTPW